VADEQLAVDQKNVRLDAANAPVKRVEEWPLVLVIVVSVRTDERPRLFPDYL